MPSWSSADFIPPINRCDKRGAESAPLSLYLSTQKSVRNRVWKPVGCDTSTTAADAMLTLHCNACRLFCSACVGAVTLFESERPPAAIPATCYSGRLRPPYLLLPPSTRHAGFHSTVRRLERNKHIQISGFLSRPLILSRLCEQVSGKCLASIQRSMPCNAFACVIAFGLDKSNHADLLTAFDM